MSSEPSSPGFSDPNARLLASVIPPPPPTLRARALRFITTRSSGDLRRMVRWSRSREGRSCFIAALAGVGLTLAFYRSESSSAASAAPIIPIAGPASAALAPGLRSEPLALKPTSTAARAPDRPLEAGEPIATSASVAAPEVGAADAAEEPSHAAALVGASEATPKQPSSRKALGAKGKSKKYAKARKAKRRSAAKASSRGSRHAKSQRAMAAGPLAAWLATQRTKDASGSKGR